MTSIELKHQARLQEWAGAIRDCRSSGLSVRQWCRERGTTPTTYYRWERELLSVASTAKALSETPAVAFAELPVPKQVCRNTTERFATLRIGNASLDIYPSCDTEQMKYISEICQIIKGKFPKRGGISFLPVTTVPQHSGTFRYATRRQRMITYCQEMVGKRRSMRK